jgi:NAD(P)H-hydrate repair Nnr-like enzyme with NAD(P)H-hydrate dehydratase domain
MSIPTAQNPTENPTEWGAEDARALIRVPQPADDKYSRGVLGIRTGSSAYPGAAVLGVDAAVRTGVGMVRYLGAEEPTRLVLQRRPEIVTTDGRVQAWLLGSGMDVSARSGRVTAALRDALGQDVPRILDAGALDLLPDADALTVITPHAGELATIWERAGESAERQRIAADPQFWALRTARSFGVTVLLKGSRTVVAEPEGLMLGVTAQSSWAATAGSGDVLGGILGALLATNAEEARRSGPPFTAKVAATAAFLHQLAAQRASRGGPIAALDIAEALPQAIATLLERR